MCASRRGPAGIYDLTETITLDKNRKHNIEIVVDRVVIRPDQNRRLTDAVEIASALSGGLVLADIPEEKREILFSQNYACDDCGISIEESHSRGCSRSTRPTRVPDLRRSWHAAAHRPGAHHSGPVEVYPRRRHHRERLERRQE